MIEILCSGLEGQMYSIDIPHCLVPRSGIEPASPAYKTGPHPLKVSRAKLGGDGENRTLNFWLQTRCVPISTTPPKLERDRRIELLTLAWKAKVIPFYESRNNSYTISKFTIHLIPIEGCSAV